VPLSRGGYQLYTGDSDIGGQAADAMRAIEKPLAV
jgi:hypothetical protein